MGVLGDMKRQISFIELIVILLLIAVTASGINTIKNRKKNTPVPTPTAITKSIPTPTTIISKTHTNSYFKANSDGYKHKSITRGEADIIMWDKKDTPNPTELEQLKLKASKLDYCDKCGAKLVDVWLFYTEVNEKEKLKTHYNITKKVCLKCKNGLPSGDNIEDIHMTVEQ